MPDINGSEGSTYVVVSQGFGTSGVYGEYSSIDVVGRKIKIHANYNDVQVSPWWQDKEVLGGAVCFSNGHYYLAMSGGKTGNIQPSHTFGAFSDGGVVWRYLHSGTSVVTITGVEDERTLRARVDGYLPITDKYVEGGTYRFDTIQWSMFGYKNVYPSEIYLHQNRLGLIINTEGYGSWNCLSCSDDYFNFATETFGAQLDTSALVNIIPDNSGSDINWVLSANQLYMGGHSGEFIVGQKNSVLTPTNISINKINETGGSGVMPLKYKELNLFVGSERNRLFSIGYDYAIDDYKPKEVNLYSDHIFAGDINRMVAINNKDQNIYIVKDSSDVAVLKYIGEQKILSYSRIYFHDCVVVDMATTTSNDLLAGYIAVRQGNDIVIERVALSSPTYMFDVVTIESDQKDSGGNLVPISMPAVPHHANKEVYIKFDGGQFKKTTLDERGNATGIPKSTTFQVGLPMVCEIHTQPAFGQKVEGMQQQSIAVYLRLYKSGVFSYGSSVDFDKYFDYKKWADHQQFEEAPSLYTGDCLLNIPIGYAEAANWGDGKYPTTSGVGINIKCDTPEPFNLLSIQEIYR